MNDLLKTRLFTLLSDPSQATADEMKNAYGHFVKQVEIVSNSETDYSVIYRNLSITRIELLALEPLNQYEQGKKCPEICLSSKSVIAYQWKIQCALPPRAKSKLPPEKKL